MCGRTRTGDDVFPLCGSSGDLLPVWSPFIDDFSPDQSRRTQTADQGLVVMSMYQASEESERPQHASTPAPSYATKVFKLSKATGMKTGNSFKKKRNLDASTQTPSRFYLIQIIKIKTIIKIILFFSNCLQKSNKQYSYICYAKKICF